MGCLGDGVDRVPVRAGVNSLPLILCGVVSELNEVNELTRSREQREELLVRRYFAVIPLLSKEGLGVVESALRFAETRRVWRFCKQN